MPKYILFSALVLCLLILTTALAPADEGSGPAGINLETSNSVNNQMLMRGGDINFPSGKDTIEYKTLLPNNTEVNFVNIPYLFQPGRMQSGAWFEANFHVPERLYTKEREIRLIKSAFNNIIQIDGKPLRLGKPSGPVFYNALRPRGARTLELWSIQLEAPVNGYYRTAIIMAVSYVRHITGSNRMYVEIIPETRSEVAANAVKLAAQIAAFLGDASGGSAAGPQTGRTEGRVFPVYKITVAAYNRGPVYWPTSMEGGGDE